jgi:hypothetical protein
MAGRASPARWSVEQLLQAVDQLSPAERREFQSRLAVLHGANEVSETDEVCLIQATETRLPSADKRRLRRLTAKCERDLLTDSELAEYQRLAQQAQQIDAERVWARAELVRRQRKSKAGAEAGRKDKRNDE